MATQYAKLEVTTPTGVRKIHTEVSSPVHDYDLYLRRFYKTATRIAWTPTGPGWKNAIGPQRVSEFDAAGNLLKREPADEESHVLGGTPGGASANPVADYRSRSAPPAPGGKQQ